MVVFLCGILRCIAWACVVLYSFIACTTCEVSVLERLLFSCVSVQRITWQQLSGGLFCSPTSTRFCSSTAV
ncbi:hypothetical protein B0T26DRAFT_180155 [Lasiosphaeria miniovina]|uniref:Uncharacterized protein n=1 Tax=Lasiosphaeria miniovina TaxID=1954250 RepID=A0AA40B6K9_9PEZI|nr:uncharacterized protein B0T26DRAFT_180155 [Lasiosphaeria miniovina]KAK0728641.1 hypothetical protein B0T26DRAFT_180155 [Lasiosphaeria miniovina]